MDFNEKLRMYAKVLITIGLNVKKNAYVVINAPIEANDIVHLCVEEAYFAGASYVHVIWNSPLLKKYKLFFSTTPDLLNIPQHEIDELNYYLNKGASFLNFTGSDPLLLKDIDPEKIQLYMKNRSTALKDYSDALMNDMNPWTVAAFAQKDWAKKVFPNLDTEEAVKQLWDKIFYACRIDENALDNWKNHIKELLNKSKILNDLNLSEIQFKSSNGTDLIIKLPEDHIWSGGSSITSNGHEFVANIPTEEIFTLPHKKMVNGNVVSTKPLHYSGVLIEGMRLEFTDGKISNVYTDNGKEMLSELIYTDEGASYLGEVALVPFNSPISNLNSLFFNTLFDENASCHLAFGKAYPTSLENGNNYSIEELEKRGVNDSLIHEDFMIGSEDLNVTGIDQDGRKICIFINGNWSI